MDPAERLAALLAGELDAHERAELEAQLARDPRLREQLAALERADEALGELTSPEPPAGFDERVHARLDDELEQVLGAAPEGLPAAQVAAAAATAAADEQPGYPEDELARQRERRAAPRWLLATSAAAAALVVVAGGGVLLSDQLRSGDDELADGDAATTFSTAEDAVPESADEAMAGEPPRIVAEDRELDDAALSALVEGPDAIALADPDLDANAAADLRTRNLAALGLAASEAEEAETPDDADAPAADDTGDTDAPSTGDTDAPSTGDTDAPDSEVDADDALERGAPDLQALRTDGPVGEAEVEAIARCLQVLLPDSPTAIPTYAELGTYEGEEVVALGLVDRDPTDGSLSRHELWILSRDDCEIRHISQG